ncbi:MAG: PQQ-binding-like beta-propeller repeat protein [Planctomycetes bacterium]|nr:PQQ-binding-like beta-propeller repeat protein [Planctomycetota bacterium]
MSRSCCVIGGRLWCRAVLLAWLAVSAAWAGAIRDFCFLHTSDNHLSPQPVGAPAPGPDDRALSGLTWFVAEAGKPQVVEPLQLTTPPPAFVIDTGDLTEYGVIHRTWDTFEAAIAPLGIPFYVTPGNHDNTWTGIMQVMRKRHGGDHYSFDKFGCHFACIDSATPQEPLPSLERRTLAWLTDDLRRVARDTPVFLFCHHPLSGPEFAKPFEQLRFLQTIEDHNVVLLMMGHGHGHRHERWNTLDSVMGGTTSHPVENIGYNIMVVRDEVLHVVFRPRDAAKPMQVVLKKPLAAARGPRIEFVDSASRARMPGGDSVETISGRETPVQVRVRGGRPGRVTASVDDIEATTVALTPAGPGRYGGTIGAADLLPGRHFVEVTAAFGDRKIDAAREFQFVPPGSPSVVQANVDAGVKAAPLAVGDEVIVVTTGGEVQRLSFGRPPGKTTAERLFDAGVEILHPPRLADGKLYFSAAEKGVHCLGLDGKLAWTCNVGATVYGTPAVDGQRVYVADMQGSAHAIDRATGKIVWSKRHAAYSVETPVLLCDGVLYFGAWDGLVYAVNADDGTLKWKKPGPAGHMGQALFRSRYYAPADCPPVAVGDRLFVTDRAYKLGEYRIETGEYLGEIASDIAAIGPTADGRGFYARGLSKGVTRYDGAGKVVWTAADVPMGRFPAPPVEATGESDRLEAGPTVALDSPRTPSRSRAAEPRGVSRVAACSNRGTLVVLDACTGQVLLRYQAAPQLHVMAPPAADDQRVYVAGMDGSVTRIELTSP